MHSRTSVLVASSVYGLLVFVGTALVGFVVAPFLGIAAGRFPIEAEARYVFSMLTLKAAPGLLVLSALSGLLYPGISGWRLDLRALALVANVLGAWLVGASVALAILG